VSQVVSQHCGIPPSRNFVHGLLQTKIIIKIPDQKVRKQQKKP